MFKPHLTLALAVIGIASLISACSTYRVSVNQGNVIDEERLAKVEAGMTPVQVEYLLGTPLVRSAIAADRWDYVLHIRRGSETLRERRVTVFFESGLVARLEDTDPRRGVVNPAENEQPAKNAPADETAAS